METMKYNADFGCWTPEGGEQERNIGPGESMTFEFLPEGTTAQMHIDGLKNVGEGGLKFYMEAQDTKGNPIIPKIQVRSNNVARIEIAPLKTGGNRLRDGSRTPVSVIGVIVGGVREPGLNVEDINLYATVENTRSLPMGIRVWAWMQ